MVKVFCTKCGKELHLDYDRDSYPYGVHVDDTNSQFCSDGTIHHAMWE